MSKIIGKIVVWLGVLMAFISCDSSLKYEHFEAVNEQGWHYEKVLNFDIPTEDAKPKQLLIAVRNTADYQRANLWLFLELKSPSGTVLRDTLDCPLADDYGYWLGSGFSGLYLTEHLVKKAKIAQKGDWKLTVMHGMRQDTIKGIKEIGVFVKDVEK